MADQFVNLPKDERLTLAVEKCKLDPTLSYRKAAKIYDVSDTAISRRIKNKSQPLSIKRAEQQLLSPVEEEELARWAIQYHEWGLPLSIRWLRQFASEILRRKDPHFSSLGVHWHQKFLARNETIKPHLSQPLNRARFRANAAAALKPQLFEDYFALFSKLCNSCDILKEDIYSMDERGFLLGVQTQQHVLIPMGEKNAHLGQDGSREWISVIECICAGGWALKSLIIFGGVQQRASWFNQLDQNAAICLSQKGWTDNEIAVHWLRKHFLPQTAKRQLGKCRLLILDGHESHCSIEFIEICAEHNVVLLCLPPHTADKLQPLDAYLFKPLGTYYSNLIAEHGQFGGTWVDRKDFIPCYQQARRSIFTPRNILSGFAATGLVPFDKEIVIQKLPPRPPTAP